MRGIDKCGVAWYNLSMQCKHCGSDKVAKYGTQRHWRKGVPYRVQHYLCNDCGRRTILEMSEEEQVARGDIVVPASNGKLGGERVHRY